MLKAFRLAVAACAALASAADAAERHKDKPPVSLPAPAARPSPVPPPETKAYDPQLMRLAEILGALTYLRTLCGQKDADVWRGRMQALLDAEGNPPVRKEKLAGAYNRGIEGYRFAYRTCTPNAHVVIGRFLEEGQRIAKEVENRYHAT
jgi:uncharacterized protein (TIGR02301 family)